MSSLKHVNPGSPPEGARVSARAETGATQFGDMAATQDETAKLSLASHYTISRDETSSGGSIKDKLRVLQTAQDDESEGLPESQMVWPPTQVSRTTGNVQSYPFTGVGYRSPRRTAPTRPQLIYDDRPVEEEYSEERNFNFAHNIADEILENTPSELYGLVLLLQEKVKALQSENKKLQQRQRENEGSVKFAIFHCILDHEDEETNETYLEKPYWVATSDGFKLKVNSPVLYPDAYVQLGKIIKSLPRSAAEQNSGSNSLKRAHTAHFKRYEGSCRGTYQE
jgi:hypothetical protein